MTLLDSEILPGIRFGAHAHFQAGLLGGRASAAPQRGADLDVDEVSPRDVRVLRLQCGVALGVLAAFGLAYRLTGTASAEGAWLQGVLAAAGLLLVGASFYLSGSERRLSVLVQGLCYAITLAFTAEAAWSGFASGQATGLLFIVPSIGVAASLSLRRLLPLAAYFVVTVPAAVGAWVVTAGGGVAPEVFLGALASVSLMTFVVAGARIRVQERFHASERRYQAVVEQSSEGICLLDAGTLAFLDANGAFQQMVGRSLDELHALTLLDVTDGEAGMLRAHLAEALGRRNAYLDEQWLLHPGGARVCVDFRTNCILLGERKVLSVLAQDVSARKQYEEGLILAKEKAEEAARFKSTLLANVSHEVRTPLSGILGWAAVLKEEVGGEHQELVCFIEENGRRLYESLNDVIELAALDANTRRLDVAVVDAAREVEEALTPLRPKAADKPLTLSYERPEAGVMAQLDPASLRRIVTHLVDNAVKFTERGSVRVALDVSGHDLRLCVSDTGVGIGDAFMPHLFEEFKQESDGLSRNHEGNGLGLAIAKRIVALYGGAIDVESAPGRGAAFTVTLPDVVLARHGMARRVA